MVAFPARSGVRRSFSRLSDRMGGGGEVVTAVQTLSPGAATFTAPFSGSFKFYMVGAGARGRVQNGISPGTHVGGGAYSEVTAALTEGQQVPVIVGAAPPQGTNGVGAAAGGDTVVQLPGRTVTAGGGQTNAGGIAVNGDYNSNGTLGNGSTYSGGNSGFRGNDQPFPRGIGGQHVSYVSQAMARPSSADGQGFGAGAGPTDSGGSGGTVVGGLAVSGIIVVIGVKQ